MYLTFHKNKNKAICHHCSYEKKIKNKCKEKGDVILLCMDLE